MERKVPLHEDQVRIPVFLEKYFSKDFSRKKWKRLMEANRVRVNGKVERFSSRRLSAYDEIQVDLAPEGKDFGQVLYEDSFYYIWNKPPGILFTDTSTRYLPAHRLDKETSGALIYAKNPSALEKMFFLFQQRKVDKGYIALVLGALNPKSGIRKSYIFKEKERYFRSSTCPHPCSKSAETLWSVRKCSSRGSLVYLQPKTGRTHQLRLHMGDLGHPILGDYHYHKSRCFQAPFVPKRLYLHAQSLRFIHPFTGEQVDVQSPMPKDFSKAVDQIFE